MAGSRTRRRSHSSWRLAGGGLAGALLAAAGFGRRAGAQGGPPCGELYARCYERAEAACGPEPATDAFGYDAWDAWWECTVEQPDCRAAYSACRSFCDCGQAGCPESKPYCIALVNPTGRLLCRCVSL